MIATEGGDRTSACRRGGRVIGESRIAALIDASRRRVTAGVVDSRSLALGRAVARQFHSWPAAIRRRAALLTAAVAGVAHFVMASALPWHAQPQRLATTILLIAVILGAASRFGDPSTS
jgi:hypothetical protein